MNDRYYRLLLRKDRDAELIRWLENGRRLGERPSQAVIKKLYQLKDAQSKKTEKTKN